MLSGVAMEWKANKCKIIYKQNTFINSNLTIYCFGFIDALGAL